MLDVVFALNRSLNFFVVFKVNKVLDGILFRRSCDQSVPVFVDASNKVVDHPDAQNVVGRARHDINVATSHKRMMKDVDGRDKPGHDD